MFQEGTPVLPEGGEEGGDMADDMANDVVDDDMAGTVELSSVFCSL